MNPPLFDSMRRLQTSSSSSYSNSSSIMEFRMHNMEGEMRNVSAQGACRALADGRAVATPILRAEPHARRRLGVFGAWFSQCHLQASPPNRPTLSALVRPCAYRTLRAGWSIEISASSSSRTPSLKVRKIGKDGASQATLGGGLRTSRPTSRWVLVCPARVGRAVLSPPSSEPSGCLSRISTVDSFNARSGSKKRSRRKIGGGASPP